MFLVFLSFCSICWYISLTFSSVEFFIFVLIFSISKIFLLFSECSFYSASYNSHISEDINSFCSMFSSAPCIALWFLGLSLIVACCYINGLKTAPVLFISSQQPQSPPAVNANSFTYSCFKSNPKKHIFSHLEPPALQSCTYQLALGKTNPGAIKDP